MIDTNVFEWCWEHTHADGDDRAVLLAHAWLHPVAPWVAREHIEHHYEMSAVDVLDAVYRLEASGELGVHGVCVTFPAYEAWLTEHEVT